MKKHIFKLTIIAALACALAANAAAADADLKNVVAEGATVEQVEKNAFGAQMVTPENGDKYLIMPWPKIGTYAAVALTLPITAPSNFLGAAWQGVKAGWIAADRIPSETGSFWVKAAIAPLALPAAILNIPSFLLSPLGLTSGY